jgi:polyphosphate kinase
MQHEFTPDNFINRELSWLEFNARVLEEAMDESTPLLERVKFLSIFSSNLDEFFMVRVAGLREQAFGAGAPQDYAPDQLSPLVQLQRIAARSRELIKGQYRCWNKSIVPQLVAEGIELLAYEELKRGELKELDRFFNQRAFPILTPMAVDPSHPRPQYHNRALYVAALLRRHSGLGPRDLFAVVQLPKVLPRLVPVRADQQNRFILIEDAVVARLPELFGGFDIITSSTFRISRDSDIELLEQEADDMMRLIEQRIKARERGQAVRVEVSSDTSDELLRLIVEAEDIQEGVMGDDAPPYGEVYRIKGPIDMTAMNELLSLPGRDQLRDPPFTPRPPEGWDKSAHQDPFQVISRRDILLHHPYESFDPVVDFVSRAANDPRVLAIKQTLYRTSGDSPVVTALMRAAENGKQVTALIELKARFDEANNVSWARQLEKAGVHVVFGFLDLKTHCKVSLVVRQENEGLRQYVHLGTGNYNPATAVCYTDVGLFTTNEDIAADVTALFNLLTGYSQGHQWRKLIVAPDDLHRRTVEMINEQAELAAAGKPSWIFAKMNALVDHRVIAALYAASQAGVPIDLIIRGICSLRPGMEGISENIRVHSIVDRFLEHSRIYAFGPGQDAKVFLSSADWMPRNFYRRVEVMFPVDAPGLRRRVINDIIPAYLADNVKTRVLGPDGVYHRAQPAEGEPLHHVQVELLGLNPAATNHEGNGALLQKERGQEKAQI